MAITPHSLCRGLIPSQGTKSLCVATKTWCSQINTEKKKCLKKLSDDILGVKGISCYCMI